MKKHRSAREYRGSNCLNCDHPLDISDKYCPSCGQLNSTKKLSFDDFFYEFFAGVFAYDSKLRNTLSVLLFSPGKLTDDYKNGKRVRYANPFKFYLSVSIIFFIIYSFTNSFDFGDAGANNAQEVQELSPEELEKLREDLNKVPALQNSPLNIDSLLLGERPPAAKSYQDKYISEKEMDSLGLFNSFAPQLELYEQFYLETEIRNSETAMDSLHHYPSTYNKWMYKKVVDYTAFKEEPMIFVKYFISKLPLIIFFYLPVFALFIWLLYWRRPFNYMEHLIFTFHVQSTFFVIMAFALILDYILNTSSITGFASLVFLFYLYKALRKFYKQGRFKTLVKFILLNGIFLTLAVIAATISLLASFAIY
ncbi:DUF3667 domain-containing protein [Antarcticibacterium arcticum]|uniref:DUF3667 domain-containing protein n=1 Tax=Antarcticibacterium arcticum TaxID=2585771 RepID=A0A5B8YEB8_9FLAO|nr:DUF3667 domain-containing protein [Antarcticibacterium arcticum]QED36235.1 DUF3667 domain-containing protein [Antarcticibacterium arcticum]